MPAVSLANQCAAPERRLALARHLLDELHTALAGLDAAQRTIARLEAGERRFTCRNCGSQVWTFGSEPPPSWRQLGGTLGDYCQDCQDYAARLADQSAAPGACYFHGTGPARP